MPPSVLANSPPFYIMVAPCGQRQGGGGEALQVSAIHASGRGDCNNRDKLLI
jgi:hypothetical protein